VLSLSCTAGRCERGAKLCALAQEYRRAAKSFKRMLLGESGVR
jgi:hypothetical protein